MGARYCSQRTWLLSENLSAKHDTSLHKLHWYSRLPHASKSMQTIVIPSGFPSWLDGRFLIPNTLTYLTCRTQTNQAGTQQEISPYSFDFTTPKDATQAVVREKTCMFWPGVECCTFQLQPLRQGVPARLRNSCMAGMWVTSHTLIWFEARSTGEN